MGILNMSEKRFTMVDYSESDGDVIYYDNGEELGSLDVLDKLNELHNENEQLKKSVKRQQFSNEECSKYIEELSKENEQLKQEIQSIYEIVEEYVHTHHAHSSMRMKKQIEKVMWND